MTRTSNLKRSAQQTARQLHRGGRRMQRVARQEANGIVDSVGQLGRSAKERLDGVRVTAAGYWSQGRRQAKAAEQSLERSIKHNPLLTVGLAAGCGFLIGRLYGVYKRIVD